MSGEHRVSAREFVPDAIHAGPSPSVQGIAQYELGYSFYNGLGCTVTLVTRSGLKIRIPPLAGTRLHGAFVVRASYGSRQNYGVGYGVIVDTGDLLNDEGLTTSKEAQVLETALGKEEMKLSKNHPSSGMVDYFFSIDDLNRSSGALYCPPLDLVISNLNPHFVPKHPQSRIGQRETLADENMSPETTSGFTYRIRIIDRHQQFGDRFVNVGGEVYLIRTEVDTKLSDGVYLISQVPATGIADIQLPRSVFYKFDEAEQKLKLYRTYTDARTLGDPKTEREQQLAERAHQIRLEESDLRMIRLRADREIEASKREFEREREASKHALLQREENLKVMEQVFREKQRQFEIEEAELKRSTMLLKDQLDRKSTSRKEVLETLKYVPAFISGVAAVYAVIKTFKK